MSDPPDRTFTLDMTLTYDGLEMLFGRDALAWHLLWRLTDLDLRDDENHEVLCCGAFTWRLVDPTARPWLRVGLIEHAPTCPWMRAHQLLNRSTDHGRVVHAWAEEG